MDASVIIVTYNSASCIAACLNSVKRQSGVEAEIIVVDNASTDATRATVEPSGVRLIANRENVGFGRACNQGLAASSGRWLYLLNPDAELVENDALARICQRMEKQSKWGLAGTRVVSPHGESEAEPASSYPDQHHVQRDFSQLPGSIAWVIGASTVLRREVYTKTAGFDPEFFLYSEETDLCLRIREAGWEIGFIEDVTVRHVGGKSEEGRDPYDVTMRKMAGLHRFWRKHYGTEDAARLVRRDLRRAGFRALLYGLRSKFQSGDRVRRKRREYEAIRDASRQYLTTPAAHSRG